MEELNGDISWQQESLIAPFSENKLYSIMTLRTRTMLLGDCVSRDLKLTPNYSGFFNNLVHPKFTFNHACMF